MDDENTSDNMGTVLTANAHDLTQEINWFAEVLNLRLTSYFDPEKNHHSIFELPPPNLNHSPSYYAQFIQHYQFSVPERLVILLALMPHIRPQVLDILWSKNEMTDRGFTEFGGWQSPTHSGFIPTGETAMFILAGEDLTARFELIYLFDIKHIFLSITYCI